MKKQLFAIAVLITANCMLPNYFYAQAPSIEWQKTYGGTKTDVATAIKQTMDGGYIVAGYSNSTNKNVTGNHGGFDYWVVKLNSSNTIQWKISLGGAKTDYASSIQQTMDGGYIVAGYSNSKNGNVTGSHGGNDYWIVKLNNSGAIQWQKTYGGTGSDEATAIKQTTDGGYIVAGVSNSTNGDVTGNHGGIDKRDCWIIKLNNLGVIQWQKTLGGTYYDGATDIQQTTDGGYIVAGNTNSSDGDVTGFHGSTDGWVVKLSASGAIQWQKSLGGTLGDYANSIEQTTDGGYIIGGSANSTDGNVIRNNSLPLGWIIDYWIVKLDNSGAIQWQKTLGGSGYDAATSIQQTADGGYIVGGMSNSLNGDVIGHHGQFFHDYWIVKLNNSGAIQWQKCLGGSAGDDAAYSIQQTVDGGYVVAGSAK